MEEKIDGKLSYKLKFYEYGEEYSGSFKGMRYKIVADPMEVMWFKKQEEKEEGHKLVAYAWPDKFAFFYTPKEEIISKEFPFTQEGKDAAVDWLNEVYDEKYRN